MKVVSASIVSAATFLGNAGDNILGDNAGGQCSVALCRQPRMSGDCWVRQQWWCEALLNKPVLQSATSSAVHCKRKLAGNGVFKKECAMKSTYSKKFPP